MFREYLEAVKEAVHSSDIFDSTYGSVTINLTDNSITYNGLPVRTGTLMYEQTKIADIYISVITKPVRQFYENDVHVSAGGFDAICVTGNSVCYMIGSWCLNSLAFQPPLCEYPGGSNFKSFYGEYVKHLEILHKEAYDNEYEEND